MKKYKMTVGLNDKNTERQEVATSTAKNILANILLNDFEIYAFTMTECEGCYKMQSTSNIVFEKSIRLEIASDTDIDYKAIINSIKSALNQETVMVEITNNANIEFI
jgi:uncharacterized protein (DUF2344 family)